MKIKARFQRLQVLLIFCFFRVYASAPYSEIGKTKHLIIRILNSIFEFQLQNSFISTNAALAFSILLFISWVYGYCRLAKFSSIYSELPFLCWCYWPSIYFSYLIAALWSIHLTPGIATVHKTTLLLYLRKASVVSASRCTIYCLLG